MSDLKNAERFLKLFPHQKYTLCYLSKTGGMRSFPCAEAKLPGALALLDKKNLDNAEIYFMVNEGNGELNAEKTACHSTKNVINLSAIFLDLEVNGKADPYPVLQEFCSNSFSPPSIVIESSPQRYHVYWLLEENKLSRDTITKWKQIQALLHSKLSSDRTMTDIPQILRVPGFQNVKKNWPVNILDIPDDQNITRYSLDSLYQTLLFNFPEIKEFKAHEPLKPITEEYKVSEGERHEEMMRRTRKWYAQGLSDDEVKCTLTGFIDLHVTNNKDFLNGKRESEIARILSSAKSYHEASIKEENQERVTKAITKAEKRRSAFSLDPDFFYQAPGLVGELTRHIVDTSDYPIPSHAFAAAVSLTGFTKARYTQGIRQLPPLNYFLCLAPSGAGKTSIQNVVKELFTKLQIQHLMEDGIASAQGLITFLAASKGLGFIIYDEVKELFQSIQSRNAATYEAKISSELTKLYTAYASSYTPPTTKTHKGKKITLHKPLFSFLGYGHFTLVESLLNKNNVLEGLIPRFIILTVDERKEVSSLYRKVPDHIVDELRHNVTKSNIAIEDEIKSVNADPLKINTDPSIELTKLSGEAQTIYNKFSDDTAKLYDSAVRERNGLEALFSRGCEQSLRLALAMSELNTVNAKTISFTTALINSQMQEFYQSFNSVVNQTQNSKEIDGLMETIAHLCSDTSDCTVSKRDLQRKVQSRYKDSTLFSKHLQELLDQEKITMFEKQMPSGRRQKCIRLDQVLD